MTNMFLMSGQKRSLFQKVWAGFMSFVLAVVWGGSSAVFALVAIPTVAQAVVVPQTLFSDGFETGFAPWNSPVGAKWSISNTEHTGEKSGKATGDTGSSPDMLKKEVSTVQYGDISLSYWYKAENLESRVFIPGHWEGQHHNRRWVSDAWTGNDDTVKLEYTLDGSTWVTLDTVDNGDDDDNWHKRTPTLPSGAANNSAFAVRFSAALDSSSDEVRIDDVLIQGTLLDTDADGVIDTNDNCPLDANTDQKDSDDDGEGNVCDEIPTQPENNTEACSDGRDNDDDGLVDGADSNCLGMFTFTKNVVGSDKPASDFTVKLCPRVAPPMLETLNSLLGVKVANATMIDPCITLTSGQPVTVPAGWYQVVETPTPNFIAQFTDGQCNFDGFVHVGINDADTCTLTNTYDICPNMADAQSTVPQGYQLNNDGQCVPVEQNSCEDVTLSPVFTSTDPVHVGATDGPLAVPTNTHESWGSISGATWIWETYDVASPTTDETKTFYQTFTVVNPLNGDASLQVLSDNSYKAYVNNQLVCEDASEVNYVTPDTCVVPEANLITGENVLKMEVKNFALAESTSESNPAGVAYKLTVNTNSCELPPVGPICDPQLNLLENAGFEEPILTPGTWSIVTDSPVVKWLFDWVTPEDGGTKGVEIQSNAAGLPFAGAQHAELDGDHPVVIWQDVPTIPGKEYALSFAYSPRAGRDAADNTIETYVNGALKTTLAVDGTANSETVWTTHNLSFVAAGALTKIEFRDTGTDTSFGGYLDATSLTCQGNPVVDVCENLPEAQSVVPEGYYGSEGSCFPIGDEGEDLCKNLDGTQTTVPEGYAAEGNQCNLIPVRTGGGGGGSQPLACQDGSDNDGDGKRDLEDPGCSNSIDNDETDVPVTPTSAAPEAGSVLGAATAEPALPPQCSEYLTEYIKFGKKNNPEEVKKLQTFLNEVMGSNLPVTGYYGSLTRTTVKNFQKKYHSDILLPWVNAGWTGKDLESGTGYVYKTTKRWINLMKCQTLDLPLPDLKAS